MSQFVWSTYPAAPGPCITNVFATRRKNFSQWHRSFQRKLLSHWLKFLRHVAITLVIQGPDNVFATRRKNFSQWHRSFQRKLLSHWLKFLRHVAITLVIQGPGLRPVMQPWKIWIKTFVPNHNNEWKHENLVYISLDVLRLSMFPA